MHPSPPVFYQLLLLFHWHIIKSAGPVARAAEGCESLSRLGRTGDKSPGGGGPGLLSPLSPRFIRGGGRPYYRALQLPCPAGLNLFVLLPHRHKIITLPNNFLLVAVQLKVNSRRADFEEAEGCCHSSSTSSHLLLSSSCSACKSSAGEGSGSAGKELLSSATPLTIPRGAVSVFLMGETSINCLIKP